MAPVAQPAPSVEQALLLCCRQTNTAQHDFTLALEDTFRRGCADRGIELIEIERRLLGQGYEQALDFRRNEFEHTAPVVAPLELGAERRKRVHEAAHQFLGR